MLPVVLAVFHCFPHYWLFSTVFVVLYIFGLAAKGLKKICICHMELAGIPF